MIMIVHRPSEIRNQESKENLKKKIKKSEKTKVIVECGMARRKQLDKK